MKHPSHDNMLPKTSSASIPPMPPICMSRKIKSYSLPAASSPSPVAKSLILKSGSCFFMKQCICYQMISSSSTTAIFKIHHFGFYYVPLLNLSANYLLFGDTGNERHTKWNERHLPDAKDSRYEKKLRPPPPMSPLTSPLSK